MNNETPVGETNSCPTGLTVLRQSGRVLLCVSLLVISGCVTTGDSTEARQGEGAERKGLEQHTTAAGHQFWYHAMPNADRTAVAVTWSSELPDESLMHVATSRVGIDLMLNGGAGGREPDEIIADFEDLDSGSRLWVQPREISGFIVSPEEHMERAAEIANLVLTQPNLSEKWFARELKVLTDDARDRQSVVAGLAWNLARELSLGDHPYKRFWSLRPVNEISSISLNDVRAWHQQAFDTTGISIAAAGNASAEKVGVEIDRMLQGMPAEGVSVPRDFPKPALPGKTVLLHAPDAPKSVILAIGNLPTISNVNDLPLSIGLGVLGQSKQSRLFKAVRSGLRAAYGFGAGDFNMTRDHKLFYISGEVETGKLQAALDETEKAYENFRLGGIGALEFPIAKRLYKTSFIDELAKPESVAYLIMEGERTGRDPNRVPGLVGEIAGLNRGVVNQVIKDSYPAFDVMLKVIVTPDANAIKGACVITDIDDWADCL